MPALREEAKVRRMPREHTERGTASGRATAQGRPRLLPLFYEIFKGTASGRATAQGRPRLLPSFYEICKGTASGRATAPKGRPRLLPFCMNIFHIRI